MYVHENLIQCTLISPLSKEFSMCRYQKQLWIKALLANSFPWSTWHFVAAVKMCPFKLPLQDVRYQWSGKHWRQQQLDRTTNCTNFPIHCSINFVVRCRRKANESYRHVNSLWHNYSSTMGRKASFALCRLDDYSKHWLSRLQSINSIRKLIILCSPQRLVVQWK